MGNFYFRILILSIAIISLFSSEAYPATASTTVYWTGALAAGACPSGGIVCGGDWQCNNNEWGGWNNGVKNFTDPIPANGGIISAVSITMYQVDCISGIIQVFLNGQYLTSFTAVGNDCTCGVSCRTYTVSYSGSLNSYNFGGTNSIQLVALPSPNLAEIPLVSFCINRATISLTYSTCTPSSFTKISPSTVWTGNVDNYWNNSSNWSNGTPTGSVNAYVPNCPTNPMVRDASYARTVTIYSDNGAQVDWGPGTTAILNVQGAF